MADVGQGSATHADGMDLRHLVGNSTQLWHRTKRHALEVEVKSGHDDTDASACQFIAYLHDMLVEELCLVNAHYVALLTHQEDAGRRIDRRGRDAVAFMADDILLAIADIDGRLEYLHALLSELCPPQTADKLLRLARKHRATHDFHTASPHHLAIR